MQNSRKKKYLINVTLLGESGVGKTTIKDRLLGKEFNDTMIPTLSPPYSENFKIDYDDDSEINILIWDTAGQEIFRANCTLAIKRADILLFVRDDKRENFLGENGWINFSEKSINLKNKKIKKILCLNKTDLLTNEDKKLIQEKLMNLSMKSSSVKLISSKNDNDITNLKNDIISIAKDIVEEAIDTYIDTINISLFGPSMVGKTSLIYRIINNDYMESTILTLELEKTTSSINLKNTCALDIKTNKDIKINYYDIPGQKQYIEKNLYILENTDIIIFVNDHENLKIEEKLIKKKINISKKKCIFCLNKSDLFSSIKAIKTQYKNKNKSIIGNNEIFIVSAKNADNIPHLIEKIYELSSNILKENNKNNKSDWESTPLRQLNGYQQIENVEERNNRVKECCKQFWKRIVDFF